MIKYLIFFSISLNYHNLELPNQSFDLFRILNYFFMKNIIYIMINLHTEGEEILLKNKIKLIVGLKN